MRVQACSMMSRVSPRYDVLLSSRFPEDLPPPFVRFLAMSSPDSASCARFLLLFDFDESVFHTLREIKLRRKWISYTFGGRRCSAFHRQLRLLEKLERRHFEGLRCFFPMFGNDTYRLDGH